jgi:hypothetical protein
MFSLERGTRTYIYLYVCSSYHKLEYIFNERLLIERGCSSLYESVG